MRTQEFPPIYYIANYMLWGHNYEVQVMRETLGFERCQGHISKYVTVTHKKANIFKQTQSMLLSELIKNISRPIKHSMELRATFYARFP